jgi:hypothetical protein
MTTFANGREVAHGGASGMSIVFPDVCKTPAPPAPSPVPIPYPNTARCADASEGPTTVKIEGHMPMVKGAKYKMSTGDEAGNLGGVMSSSFKGPAEFMVYSFDVKLDGKNACRLGDALFHNKKNIMG